MLIVIKECFRCGRKEEVQVPFFGKCDGIEAFCVAIRVARCASLSTGCGKWQQFFTCDKEHILLCPQCCDRIIEETDRVEEEARDKINSLYQSIYNNTRQEEGDKEKKLPRRIDL